MFNSFEEYLLGQLGKNQVVLFLGAGFSSLAKNRLGNDLPIGESLTQKIWELLYPGKPYEYASLKIAFQALLNSSIGNDKIKLFLEENLLVEEIPDFYYNLSKPFWYKIYTTNVDNLLDGIYSKSEEQVLDVLNFPNTDFVERDQSLDRIQAIHLNGKLEKCEPSELIFATEQYAINANLIQPYYLQFASEYANRCTIFIGSSMEEDYMWQYIEERKFKRKDVPELRLKSFLISPNISALKEAVLEKYNVISIKGTAEDFCNWINKNSSLLQDKNTVLKNISPSLSFFLSLSTNKKYNKTLKEFSQTFEPIPKENPTPSVKSYFLIGASPTWNDIFKNLDAKRNSTEKIVNKIKEYYVKNDLKIVAVLGSAGCGKSTILKRIAYILQNDSFNVFFSNSDYLLSPQTLADALDAFDKKTILIFDFSISFISKLHLYLKELENCKIPPIIVLASRLNDFDRLASKQKAILELEEMIIPDLTKSEILDIIEKLEVNHLEGSLKGKRKDEQISIFENVARKQILIAMKEATQGERFDLIIKDEFKTITPEEAQLLCLCVALATDAGYKLTKEQFIACSQTTPSDVLYFLDRNLKGIIITEGITENNLTIRHKIIAEQYIYSCAEKEKLKQAYIRLLKAISIYKNVKRYGFNLYKDLINHKKLYQRMGNLDDARYIFEEMMDMYNHDFQFWHQYGTLEIIGGNFDLAENYLLQAKALNPKDYFIDNSYGNLYMKRAIQAPSATIAVANYEKGQEILNAQIAKMGETDPYCYHILCAQSFNYINAWFKTDELKRKKLVELKDTAQQAVFLHPKHKKINDIFNLIKRAELNLSIPVEKRPKEPVVELEL